MAVVIPVLTVLGVRHITQILFSVVQFVSRDVIRLQAIGRLRNHPVHVNLVPALILSDGVPGVKAPDPLVQEEELIHIHNGPSALAKFDIAKPA